VYQVGRGEGSEADQLLAFEKLYLQVGACLSQRFNQNTKQLTADQNTSFESYVRTKSAEAPSLLSAQAFQIICLACILQHIAEHCNTLQHI